MNKCEAPARKLSGVLIASIFFACISWQAQGAMPVKDSKERLVLMPMRVDEGEKNMLASMEVALVQGLQLKYEVFSGEQVAQKSREIFRKESLAAKKECDETRCMEDIAIAFQAELIATANVTKIEGGYLLALSIRNVMDNKAVYSNSVPCERCNVFDVVEKLKGLSDASAPQVYPAAEGRGMPSARSGNSGDLDTTLWNEVKNSNLIEDFQAYLAQYPKGKYALTAAVRIKKLRDEAGSESVGKEQSAWQVAEQAGGEADYQNYIRNYPQGSYVGLAQVRIRKLQSNNQVSREEQVLWQAALEGYSVQAVQAYLDKYPNGKYVELANKRINKIRQEDATAKRQPVQADEQQSAADRLREAEAAGREKDRESRGVIVLPRYMEKIITEIKKW
ncbi:MAG: peptidase C14 caspase catalytic subunit [Gallionellaceae bacterium]|nr:MAG: peptidase C14 caspase catalytic subunit [Gallionellaceae bacterium]